MRCPRRQSWEGGIKTPTNLILLSFLAVLWWPAQAVPTSDFQLRQDYLSARDNLRQGRKQEFRRLARKLDDYVLRPYLDYHDLRVRLGNASTKEVLSFINTHGELPATHILHKRWLRSLGQRRQWQTLRNAYIETADAEINCYHLRALYGTGDKALALDATTELWVEPRSQPKACDPLFEAWRNTPRFTQAVVWQRFSGAIAANQRTLASYLLRYFGSEYKPTATKYYNVHVTPTRITRTNQYRSDDDKTREVIQHGLQRLAGRDVEKAAKAWRAYQRSHQFSDQTRTRIEESIIKAWADQEAKFPTTAKRGQVTSADTIEALANIAIEHQNWPEVSYWISQLPPDLAVKSQWRYWQSRAQQSIQGQQFSAPEAFLQLAKERHYYGFLAAAKLGVPGKMNATTQKASAVAIAQIRRHPSIARSIELFAVGDDINGRREWYQALNELSYGKQVHAAILAAELGLTTLAIRSANIAEATDHLELRFPVVYEPQFRRATLRTGVPAQLLMAIARQESAMQADARSSADARGLMQLLPSTARLVARRAGEQTPSAAALYDPGTNIVLGSYHLAWLINRYDGQTPLAIAAYNAGEHRVDRWIKDADQVSMDVWIERIPFRETRNYVKNVLAFRHVYGDKLNAPTPILSPQEQRVTLR